MRVTEFDFQLPEGLIAQEPTKDRGASRMMILDRTTGAVSHDRFAGLADQLRADDLLVLNDTKVVPARLRGRKPTGGAVEMLLVERVDNPSGGLSIWRALIAGSRALRPGAVLTFPAGLRASLLERDGDFWRLELFHGHGDLAVALETVGEMPLPPYIRRDPEDPRRSVDRERYQTVYAAVPGALAAPTAGLHVTRELLESLHVRGVASAVLTLHVGPGTFLPLRVDDVERHRMHAESYVLPPATAEAIVRARSRGGRIVAVGTTVARTLESCPDGRGGVLAGRGRSSLFIYPGFRFQVVDALVTNFHLPKSTLLMLVCALAGTSSVLAAYREAIREGYRFYSYGDAMLVRPA